MSYIYRLAGENLELAKAELKGFLESQEIQEKTTRTGRIAETNSEPSQLKRLAQTHEVSRKLYEGELDSYEPGLDLEESFKVKAHNHTEQEINKKEVEEHLGEKITGEVNLDYPKNTIHVYFTSPENCLIGLEVEDIDRTLFDERKNQERPFSSPISMDPKLARTLVNLSGAKPGTHLIDPFCGTGGILIEAGLCGIGVHGLDIQKEMKTGAQQNLEEYGIISHNIREGDIQEIQQMFDLEDIETLITDLPYGKASKKTEEPVESFLEFLEEYDGRAVFVYNEKELGDYVSDYEVYVHGSLTRHIFIV